MYSRTLNHNTLGVKFVMCCMYIPITHQWQYLLPWCTFLVSFKVTFTVSGCEYESHLRSYEHYLSSSEKKALKKFRPERDLNPWPLRYRCSALVIVLVPTQWPGWKYLLNFKHHANILMYLTPYNYMILVKWSGWRSWRRDASRSEVS